MADSERNVRFVPIVSPEEAIKGFQKLAKSAQKVFDDLSMEEPTREVQRFQANLGKTVSDAGRLKDKLEEIRKGTVPTEEFKNLSEELAESQKEADGLNRKLARMREHGQKNTSEYARVSEQWEKAAIHAEDLYETIEKLKTDGKAFSVDTEAESAVTAALEAKNNQLRLQQEAIAAYQQKQSEASKAEQDNIQKTTRAIAESETKIINSTSKLDKFVNTLSRIGSVGRRAFSRLGSALLGLTRKFKQAGTAAGNFVKKLNFGRILSYAVGIRGLFSVFSQLRSAIASGIQSMARMNGGINQTNAAMTQLTSTLNLVKGSLAAAFVPILTSVTPMLTNFMQQLANVITMVGMFIAKLTGAKSYMKATFKTTNYGAGSGGGGKSAQEKYDEAVKKAQEKYDKKVAETEAKNAERMAKAEDKQAKAADKLAKKQEKANNKLADFDDLNVLGVESLEELEEQEADLLDMPELELPNLEDFTGSGGGASDPFGLEEVPIEDWEWNWDELLAKARELGEKLAEFLNDIFKDEDLAKRIGNAIGNLINLAIEFAYGFVNKFNFHQFGRWIGALLQEAIETIEWERLGETIGKFVNGIADTIVGFFETYQVGTLGKSISDMLNRAIDEIDPDLIAQATLDLLQAPLLELREVLTETHWRELGEKVGRWFRNVFSKEGLKGETLGQTIGKTLADAINTGVDFLLGLKLTTVVSALCTFFEDLIGSALTEIDWLDLLNLMFGRGGLLDALLTFNQRIGKVLQASLEQIFIGVCDLILRNLPEPLKEIAEKLLGVDIQQAIDELDQKFIAATQEVENLRDGTITAYDEMSGRARTFREDLDFVNEGWKFNKEQLEQMVETGALTAEQVEKLIQGMEDYATRSGETFDKAKLGLDGYEGNWELFVARQELRKDKLLGQNEEIQLSDKATGDLAKGVHDEMFDLKGKMGTYSEETNANLTSMQENAGITVTSFEDMATQLNTSLETLTEYIQTWYDNMVLTYFSYDVWLTLLQEGPLLAFTDFFTTYFFVTWDEQMQLWWTEHVLKWFTNDWWNEQIYTPWETFRNQKWEALMKWWDSMMKSWWDTKVVPWFKEQKWKDQFDNIKKAATRTGEETQKIVTQFANDTCDAIIEACDRAIEKIEEVIAKLEEALGLAEELASAVGAGGGGGGSSSGGGGGNGGYSNGGGGGSGGFLPALNIMHFEDNLGMSAFKFPELATGAVIPPNNKFLAVLGDQKSGMNIETPLATMVEAFRSVMDEYMNPSTRNATMEVDGETFARLMMPHMMDEMHRLGYNTEIIEGI